MGDESALSDERKWMQRSILFKLSVVEELSAETEEE